MLRFAQSSRCWPRGLSYRTVGGLPGSRFQPVSKNGRYFVHNCLRSLDVDFPVFAVLKTHLPIHYTINSYVPSFLRYERKIIVNTVIASGRLR